MQANNPHTSLSTIMRHVDLASIGYQQDTDWVMEHLADVWHCLDELKQARQTITSLEEELENN